MHTHRHTPEKQIVHEQRHRRSPTFPLVVLLRCDSSWEKNDLPINATNDACFLMYLAKVVYVAYMQ